MLIDWLLYPLVLVVACLGHGLLIRRITGGVSNLLLLPVGFASLIVFATLAMRVDHLYSVAWVAIVIPALVGIATIVPTVRRDRSYLYTLRPSAGPAAAAFLAFAAYAAPVVLSGESGFTGFSVIVDLGHHFDYSGWLIGHGYTTTSQIHSSFEQIGSGLVSSNYPMGFAALLAASSELFGRDLAWLYQPTVAFAAPIAALAAYRILGSFGLTTGLRTLGAVVCAQPTLIYAYSMAAGFKEFCGLTMALIVAALLSEMATFSVRALLVLIVPLLAGQFVFGLTIAPWMAAIVGVFALYAVLRLAGRTGWPLYWRFSWRNVSAVVVLAIVGLLGLRYANHVSVPGIVTDPVQLGNLSTPVSMWSTAGVWPAADYRYPLTVHSDFAHVLIGAVLALAAIGVIHTVRSRMVAGVAAAVAVVATLLVFVPKTGPWLDFKAFAVNGGLVLIVAFAGVAALRRSTSGLTAWVAALGITGAVLWGNTLVYHNVTLAPVKRFKELAAIDKQFAGQGPAMILSFDEFAEYFLRDIDATGRVDPLNGVFPAGSLMGADIAMADFSFMQQHRLLILRRGPDRTRPPSNYRLVKLTTYYEVWKKVASEAPIKNYTVLPPTPHDRKPAYCRQLAKTIRAINPSRVLWATAPTPYMIRTENMPHPPAWPTPDPTRFQLDGPARVDVNPVIPGSARYEMWAIGSFQRPIYYYVDGKLVGTTAWDADYPAEAHFVGWVQMNAGSHGVSIVERGGSLAPGSGNEANNRFLYRIYFRAPTERGGQILTQSADQVLSTCRGKQSLVWVEAIA